MPYSERERPPGPFTDAAHVRRVPFRFDDEARRQLSELLAKASPELTRPCAPPSPEYAAAFADAGLPVPKTPAEWIIGATEQQIRLLLSAREADPKAAPGNPANYRAAIRRLRQAMKPFVLGWVDLKTAEIADWRAIDAALVEREAELAAIKRPIPYQRRELNIICPRIAVAALGGALNVGVELSDDRILRFVHAAMSMAAIELPHPDEHRGRLRELVFGEAPSEG
jgi:hypothetical protein